MSMRGLRNVLNHFRFIKGNNALVVTFFGLGLLSFGVLGLTQFTSAQAADCSANSVMKCGATSAQEFKNKCTTNAEGDLRAIYGHYRIPCDIQVVEGVSYKDNTVRVNGRVVATNAQSVGRVQKPGDHAISIAGKTYWEAPNSVAFRSDALPTFVALDAQGNFKYAIIKDCGNPIYATPVPPAPTPTPPAPTPTPPAPQPQPQYTCDKLYVGTISNTKKRLSVTATATNGAEIVGYTFDFGDGTSQDTPMPNIEHTYDAPGTYTAKATVKVKVGNEVKPVTGPACAQKIEMNAPAVVECVALNVSSQGNNTYSFTIVESHKDATYKGATLTFGDGNSTRITGTEATHQYAQPGNYTIVATLAFDVVGQTKTVKCEAKVTAPVTPAVTPPPAAPPAAPAELPKTGIDDILLSGFGAGSMIVSASLYLGSRRDLLATLLG